jgi:hypothetical protein
LYLRVIEDYNKGITNPNGVLSGIVRHNNIKMDLHSAGFGGMAEIHLRQEI